MTPTREQVIEWAKAAGLSFDDGWIFYTPERPSLPEAEIDAFVAAMNAAYSAGRLKGLDEAKEAVDALHAKVADPIFGQERHDVGHAVIDNCAAAIGQLKEQK